MLKYKSGTFRRIDKKIENSFVIVLVVAVLSVIVSYLVIKTNQDKTAELINETNPTLLQINKLQLLVNNSAFYTSGAIYNPQENFYADSLRQLKNKEYIKVKSKLMALNKPENSDYFSINKCINTYDHLLSAEDELITHLYAGINNGDTANVKKAIVSLQTNIIPASSKLSFEIKKLSNRQAMLLNKTQDEMLYSYNWILIVVIGLSIMLLILMLNAAFIIKKQIVKPVLKVQSALFQLGRGELPNINIETPDNAIGVMINELKKSIHSLRKKAAFVEEIGKGNLHEPFEPLSNKDVQGKALLEMRDRLIKANELEHIRRWQHEGLVQLNEIMRTSKDITEICEKIIETIVHHLGIDQAAIFLQYNEDLNDLHIQLGAYHNLNSKIINSKRYELKTSLIGKVLETKENIICNNTYDPYFTIEFEDGKESKTCNIVVIPLVTSGTVVGAIQIAKLNALTVAEVELLEKMAEPIAASLYNVRANLKTNQLLIESTKQAEELVYQEQELKKINNELTQKSELLEASEEELKYQQEELKKVNIILEEKAKLLEEKNAAIEDARKYISAKAQQLEQSNKYKSAFLANMSHELRTPLNSILILAKLLGEDKSNLLSDKQKEHAQVIYKSGSDLLMLINDILDLSKIEAGKLDLQFELMPSEEIIEDIRSLFAELANENKVNFEINSTIEKSNLIITDRIRTEQILKNLLSNAFKFTPVHGSVKLLFQLDDLKENLIISVSDTGIGIPQDKQTLIFDAFQQADGSTSRKYGGTGLGLAICKELTMMMGGKIELFSEAGKGSCFTITLPQKNIESIEAINKKLVDEPRVDGLELPSEELQNKPVLIVEDDIIFANVLIEYCKKYNHEYVVAHNGSQALELIKLFNPCAIILDLIIPQINGWEIIEILRGDSEFNKTPIHVISAAEKVTSPSELNVNSYLPKPVSKQDLDFLFTTIKVQHQLSSEAAFIGSPNDIDIKIIEELSKQSIHLTFITDASTSIQNNKFEFVLISNNYVINSENLSKQIFKNIDLSDKPLVYINDSVDECLREIKSIIQKEKIIEPVTILDHEEQIDDSLLKGKKIMVVDDDVRNIYSLTSILEEKEMIIQTAFSGNEAIEKLKSEKVDIIIMDIMMPEKNGYETIQEIRLMKEYSNLPIIAVTAKAMKGDKELCINAGANDYLTKPIQTDLLIKKIKQQLNINKHENA